jgi:NitT/TauT family transport system substrate-binding protein
VQRRAFLASGAAALAAPGTGHAQSLTTVHAAVGYTDDSSAVLIGAARGIFRTQGLDVVTDPITSSAAALAGVAGGSYQTASATMTALVLAHAHGAPYKSIAPGHIHSPQIMTEGLLVRKDSAIASVKDLNGKTLAVASLQDINSLSTQSLMEQSGADPTSLRQVEIPFLAQIPALEAGRVDAAVLGEPLLSQAMKTGKFRVLARPYNAINNGKSFLITVNVATADWIASNPDAAARFSRAKRDANRYANTHHDETAEVLAKWMHGDEATLKQSQRLVFAQTTEASAIAPVIALLAKYKLIDRPFDPKELIGIG